MDWVEALVTQSINTQLPAAQHQSLNIGRINVSLSVLDMGRNISIIIKTLEGSIYHYQCLIWGGIYLSLSVLVIGRIILVWEGFGSYL